MKYVTIEQYEILIQKLIKELNLKEDIIYGIPKNGSIVAESLRKEGFSIIDDPEKATIFVDDLVDSGTTKKKYEEKYNKKVKALITKTDNEWIKWWFEKDETDIKDSVIRIFESIGENPKRAGLIGTPLRIEKMFKEIFKGYDITKKPKLTIFENKVDGVSYDEMIIDTGDVYSFCEHHMLPFIGKYYFAYIPDKKILGLSKVARIVDFHSSKLQIQERLVKDILDDLEKEIQPLGIALVIKAEHLCKTMRGVKKKGQMIASDLRGVFKDKPETRQEFLRLING